MKRIFLLPTLLLLLFSTGCAPNGGFFGNYRSIEQLQLVHTLGLDSHSSGVEVSAAGGEASSGGGEENSGPGILRLSARGKNIADGVAALQRFAGKEELYFAHTRYVLVGAEYAEKGLTQVIDFLEHSPQLRSDLPLFVVKNGSAKDFITKSGGKDSSVFDLMEAVVRSCTREGAGYPFTCGDMAIFNAERGSALVCALEAVPTKDANDQAEEEELTPVAAGYAIIKDKALAGYLSKDTAQGVNLLLEQWGTEVITLELNGSPTTLQFTNVKTQLQPKFGKSGTLVGLTVAVQVQAELENAPNADLQLLSRALARRINFWMEDIFRAMRATEADFLGFGPKIAVKHPQWQGKLTDNLATMTLNAEIDCKIFTENP